jgi:type IV pilus assembly protein PilV
MLGVAGMQARIFVMEQESYGRSQALVLLNDIVERIYSNQANVAAFVGSYGTGSATLANCQIAHPTASDVCDWSELIKAAQVDNPLVSLQSARACITQTQAPSTTTGACLEGRYKIELVWQGKSASFSPVNVTCGAGLYGTENYRRAVTTIIGVGVPTCN